MVVYPGMGCTGNDLRDASTMQPSLALFSVVWILRKGRLHASDIPAKFMIRSLMTRQDRSARKAEL